MEIQEIYSLLLARNARETTPFLSVHESNATLLNQVDALQDKCEALERELVAHEQELNEASHSNSKGPNSTAAAALKNEARLRDKLEKVQEELNDKLKQHADEQANALKTAKELSEMKDLNTAQESTIGNLRTENQRAERAIEHLTNELNDAKSRTKLAEQQYVGLKDTIRTLQEENDTLKKENREMESRLVADKEKISDEMNALTTMVESLKKEVDMLRSLKNQEEKRKSWFGISTSTSGKDSGKSGNKVEKGASTGRRFGSFGVVLPSGPKHTIQAHTAECTCVRYDSSGSDLIASASSDATVKVWDTATGNLRATLRGGTGHTIIGCDISGGLVVGGGSDKTCRVWNLRTERMIHHLVGHAHKVTCVRLIGDRAVISGSADRSLKLWDISRTTYRQTTTLRHGSTSNCVDVGSDSFTTVSGHLDGGLRFWDLRTGERTADIAGLHEGSITSVQFHPSNSTQVLTNAMDSCLKLVDIRTSTPILTMRHAGFNTSSGWSSCAFSPDGSYAASGSSSNGTIFVWDLVNGDLKKMLDGHKAGVCGFAWGRGGNSGQQVASVDRKGILVLWA